MVWYRFGSLFESLSSMELGSNRDDSQLPVSPVSMQPQQTVVLPKTVPNTNEADIFTPKVRVHFCTQNKTNWRNASCTDRVGKNFQPLGTRTYATKISHVNFLQATRRHRSSANAAHYNPSGIQSKAASQDGGALIAVQSGTECAASLVFFLLQPFFLRPG